MPQKFTKKQLKDMKIQAAHIYRDMESDPEHFIVKLCKLKDQSLGKSIPFNLWPAQKTQLKMWIANDRSITLKSRQLGISWESAAYMLHQIFFRAFFKAKIVSRKEETAIEYLDKVKFMYEHLPSYFKQLIPIDVSNKLEFKLKNGASALAESANLYAAKGDTLNLLVFDEASIIPEGSVIFSGAEPTLRRTNGKAILIATANGYDPFFQPIFSNAMAGKSQFVANFISWKADPTTSKEWYDKKRESYKNRGREDLFIQEHPSNWVEAFIVSGNPVFDSQMIQNYLNKPKEPPKFGFLKNNSFQEISNGDLSVFEHPKKIHNYCIGADTAEGLEHGDYCTAAIYDRSNKLQVAEYRAHVDPGEFGTILNNIAIYYNKAVLNVEMNNTGYATLNTLVKHLHYPKIYRQIRYDQTSNKKSKMLGWKTTSATKPVMIEILNNGLKEHIITPQSMFLFEELKTFVRTQTGFGTRLGATAGNHDDLVIAHSLAAIVMETEPLKLPQKRDVGYKGKERFKNVKLKNQQYSNSKISKMFGN